MLNTIVVEVYGKLKLKFGVPLKDSALKIKLPNSSTSTYSLD
jgi:hypothetical protein